MKENKTDQITGFEQGIKSSDKLKLLIAEENFKR